MVVVVVVVAHNNNNNNNNNNRSLSLACILSALHGDLDRESVVSLVNVER